MANWELIVLFIFLFIGALLPFDYWHADTNIVDGWRLFVLGVVILILRRLPFVIPMVSFDPFHFHMPSSLDRLA